MMVDIPDDEVIVILKEYASLVRGIARSTYKSSPVLDLDDLCQIGEVAVLRAIREYDPTSGMSMRSFVTRLVRQDIYNEAARFLGMFTVDRRVTRLASKVNDLYTKGKSDQDIANTLEISIEQVRDLRFIMSCRHTYNDALESQSDHSTLEEQCIDEIFLSCISNDLERRILKDRILGNLSLQEMADLLGTSLWKISHTENIIKERIRKAIKDSVHD